MANKTNEDHVAHAKEDARKAMKMAKAQFKEARDNVKKYMKENPVKAAMMAAGLGAAIGAATVALIRRRRGNRKKSGE